MLHNGEKGREGPELRRGPIPIQRIRRNLKEFPDSEALGPTFRQSCQLGERTENQGGGGQGGSHTGGGGVHLLLKKDNYKNHFL